jgi:hypothetical protein
MAGILNYTFSKPSFQKKIFIKYLPIKDEVIQKYDIPVSIWNPNIHETKIPLWWNPSEDTNNMYYDPTKIALDRLYMMKYENGYLFYLILEI